MTKKVPANLNKVAGISKKKEESYAGSIAGSLVMVLLSNMLTSLNLASPIRNVLNAVILVLLLMLYNRGKAVRQ